MRVEGWLLLKESQDGVLEPRGADAAAQQERERRQRSKGEAGARAAMRLELSGMPW